jgi:alanyl-tRNA synthetase
MPEGEPGGPDSEMFWDFGAGLNLHEQSEWKDQPCHVNCDCGRFLEIGNNVFMEYVKVENGFEKLKQQNVDFGGGLERMAASLNNDPDIFKIDLFAEIVKTLENTSGKKYLESAEITKAFRVIADHARASVFLVNDGVEPSNKDRGYVLRRLLRRSIVYAKQLELTGEWLKELVTHVVNEYTASYPDLKTNEAKIVSVITAEEKKFTTTLAKGLKEFEKLFTAQNALSGTDAFNLYQTYGFPWEITHELVTKKGSQVSSSEFEAEFKKHQDLSRTASAGDFKGGLASHSEKIVKLHTATHLMQKALRVVLGDHVWQKGSNITEERTRFDFTHPEKMTDEQKKQVEDLVNGWISRDLVVKAETMPLEKARELGAIGLFGEKYGDMVSVYTIVDKNSAEVVSREFCGGPHVEHTGSIGKFKIIKEEAVSAGVRRIKATIL